MKTPRIYLDYASLTPIDPKVLAEMNKYSSAEYANPSSWYQEGVAAKKALDGARTAAAGFLHAHADEIVFTSGGTEANNLAILGSVKALHESGTKYEDMHMLTSPIEHSSVIECFSELKRRAAKVEYIAVDKSGLVDLVDLKKKIRPDTVLVSVMTVNNEVGTIQPIREIAKIVRHARSRKLEAGSRAPLLHTDAAQAALYSDLNVEQLGIDLLTLDGSKMYGPRGIGCLYVKRHTPLVPIILGGGQENGLRSGTENIPAILGFVKALELASRDREKESKRVNKLRDLFMAKLKKIRPDVTLNGYSEKYVTSAPHILNVSIPGIDNEFFIFQLDANGIACSTKSSCLRDADESYVLKAIGADSSSSIRFSFGRWTKAGDIAKSIDVIRDILSGSINK